MAAKVRKLPVTFATKAVLHRSMKPAGPLSLRLPIGPLAPVANSVRPIIRPQGMPAQQQQGGQSDGSFGPGTVVIQVNSVDEALEAKRHLEARQLAGFGVTR